jgi:hypothetical protein
MMSKGDLCQQKVSQQPGRRRYPIEIQFLRQRLNT